MAFDDDDMGFDFDAIKSTFNAQPVMTAQRNLSRQTPFDNRKTPKKAPLGNRDATALFGDEPPKAAKQRDATALFGDESTKVVKSRDATALFGADPPRRTAKGESRNLPRESLLDTTDIGEDNNLLIPR